jgi:hypothetical protein
MQARQLFDVAARSIGLWNVIEGTSLAGSYVNLLTKLWTSPSQAPNALLVLALARLLPGIYLLFYAHHLVGHIWARNGTAAETATRDEMETESRNGGAPGE